MNLHETIKQRFNLRHTGDVWQPVCCPIHQEASASAGINLAKNGFNCFVCGGMSLPKLAARIGLEYDATDFFSSEEQTETPSFLHHLLSDPVPVPIKKQIKEIEDFCTARRISFQTIEKWGGSYCNDPSNQDRLYGYLVFKIGKGYAARKMLASIEGDRFRNSKGNTSLLGKENLKLLEPSEPVILVEGITDFLTLCELGYKNAVCSLGAKLAPQQAYLLRNRTVFILYDRDYAGFVGAKQASEMLREYKATPIVIELPDNKQDKNDLNDMYCKDEAELKTFLRTSLTRHTAYDTDFVQKIRKTPPKIHCWPTGIAGLDAAFNGGFTNGVYAFTGAEKVGKSTTVCNLSKSFVRKGARVYLATYELSSIQYYARLVANETPYSWVELEQDFSLVSDEVNTKFLSKFSSNFKIDVGPTVEQIVAAQNNFDVFIIDYIQRMPPVKDGMEETSALVYNNRALAELMAKHNKTVVIISSMPNNFSQSMYKGTGDIKYTIQGGIYIQKTTDNEIQYTVIQNTRGIAGSVVRCEVDWRKQTLREINSSNFMENLK